MSKLHRFIMANGGYAVTARQLKMSWSGLWRIAHGNRTPSFKTAVKIFMLSGLSYEDVIEPALKERGAKRGKK